MDKPLRKEIKIKCLQGQMKEGGKEIDCSSYPRGMKHEVLSHYQNGYIRGLSIGIDQTIADYATYLAQGEDGKVELNEEEVAEIIKKMGSVKIPIHKVNDKYYYSQNPEDIAKTICNKFTPKSVKTVDFGEILDDLYKQFESKPKYLNEATLFHEIDMIKSSLNNPQPNQQPRKRRIT